MSTPRQTILFYCQHSIGLGHLVRSLALVDGLSEQFDVVLLNGGRMPDGIAVSDGVTVVNLPALGQLTHDLISYTPDLSVDEALLRRRDLMLQALELHRPAALVVELFPFGRKKFAPELIPVLDAVHEMGAKRPVVACSVRDILVGDRPDQATHDDRASRLCNRYFDAVLVHSDPRFARLEETFRPETPLRVPVHYTGFVVPRSDGASGAGVPQDRVLVSAGGGMAGDGLVRAAVAAQPTIREQAGLDMTVVAGPFAPTESWEWLTDAARRQDGLEVVRQVADLEHEMRRSRVSVSQCGYNTAMDVVRAGVPAVVVPYAERRDTEQTDRARRLAAAGVVQVIDQRELTPDALARCVRELARRDATPRVSLDLDGRAACARIVGELVRTRPAAAVAS